MLDITRGMQAQKLYMWGGTFNWSASGATVTREIYGSSSRSVSEGLVLEHGNGETQYKHTIEMPLPIDIALRFLSEGDSIIRWRNIREERL
jgi:hypothetical protein